MTDEPPLDEDQACTVDCILKRLRGNSGGRPYFFITGYPGAGKTRVAREVIHSLRSQNETIVLTWNALSARVLDGQTVMEYFSLPFERSGIVGDNAYMRSRRDLRSMMMKSMKTERRERIASSKAVLLIDEISAIHSSVFDAMSDVFKTIREGQERASEPFGGVPTLLFGDFLQLGRVEFCATSVRFPPNKYLTGPCWDTETWRDMEPTTIYLSRFHRGSDEGYLRMLSEIRLGVQVRPGVPKFSEESLHVLQSIRDRDGGESPPMFEHVCLVLTNREVEDFNEKYIANLPGEAVVIKAEDKYFGAERTTFVKQDVDKLGFKDTLELKRNCRVIATVNDPKNRFVNGTFGTVLDIGGLHSRIVVKFDGNAQATNLEPHNFTVYEGNAAIFNRKQFPLALGACMTVHKTVGMTLPGIWCRFPFGGASKSSDSMVEAFWSKPWLYGALYTALSRTGDKAKVRVYPVRRSSTKGEDAVLPMFFMDPEALEFDRKCRERNWLTFRWQNSPAQEPSEGSPQATTDRIPPTVAGQEDIEFLKTIREDMDALRREVREQSDRILLAQKFSQQQGTSAYINPVVYCWSNPVLSEKVAALPLHIQDSFYKLMHEEFNLASDPPENSDVINLINRLLNEESPAGTVTYSRRAVRSHSSDPLTRAAASGTADAQEETPEVSHESADDGQYHVPETEHHYEPPSGSEYENRSSSEEVEPPHGKTQFEPQPFLVRYGTLKDVVEDYLNENDHMQLEHGYTIKKLGTRKSCRLRCKKTVSKKLEGKERAQGHNADWRDWPAFTCHLKERDEGEAHTSKAEAYTVPVLSYASEARRFHSNISVWEDFSSREA